MTFKQAIVFLNPKHDIPECSTDAAAMLRRAGIPNVSVVSLEAIHAHLARIPVQERPNTLYVQPGGGDDVDTSFANYFKNNKKFKTAVQEFVADGGVYLGICLGAYAAAIEQFDLVHDNANEPFFCFDELDGDDAKIVPIDINGVKYQTYHQGGPDLSPMLQVGATPFGTYPSLNNAPVGVMLPHFNGRGTIGLLSPHFEATDDWDDALHGKRADDCLTAAKEFLDSLAQYAKVHLNQP